MKCEAQVPSPMNELTELLDQARIGVESAESAVHREFVDKLVCLASRRINDRFRAKIAPEEVVQSVFASFFRRHRAGEFDIANWNDLWALLVTITVRKCVNKVEGFMSSKRNVDREIDQRQEFDRGSSIFGPSKEPAAEDVAIFNETLDHLFDQLPETLQEIVCLRLQGMSNLEISEKIGRSERTVYRALNRVRQIFQELDS